MGTMERVTSHIKIMEGMERATSHFKMIEGTNPSDLGLVPVVNASSLIVMLMWGRLSYLLVQF